LKTIVAPANNISSPQVSTSPFSEMNLEDVTTSPLPTLRPREADSHKGDFGRALLVGGSLGMSGAISLAGKSTLRSGAGLVTVAVPASAQGIVASIEPCYMSHALADEDGHVAPSAADELLAIAENATAVALGPGIGRSAAIVSLVEKVYRTLKQPMVVDADGLFALSKTPATFAAGAGPRVLTPHPGEFSTLATALTGSDDAAMDAKSDDGARRKTAAAFLAQRDPSGQTIVVLKGHHTVVTDGKRISVNNTGNPGMASGGSGDVLTGIITAMLCQGLEPFDAARLGVHVHGLAGDLASEDLGQVSMIASDLTNYLPKAFQAVIG
jgi:NAD(P)H-hydrate epimerase